MNRFLILARRGDGRIEPQFTVFDTFAEAWTEAGYRAKELVGVEFLVAPIVIDVDGAKLYGNVTGEIFSEVKA